MFLWSNLFRTCGCSVGKYNQKPNEPLRLYIYRCSKIHKSLTKRDACYDTDPSRSIRFLTSITNTTIADKITRSEFLPQNLQQCFEKALQLEASLQLSEGVNMAWKTTIINVNVEDEDEVNLIKDAWARSNACYKWIQVGNGQYVGVLFVIPRSVLPRVVPGLDKINKYVKSSAEIPSTRGRYRQHPWYNQEKSVKRHTIASYH